jgi:general stress protein 26
MNVVTIGNLALMAQLHWLIDNIPMAMLAARDSGGVLSSRPMSPLEVDDEGVLWFFTDRRWLRDRNLRDVNLSFIDGAQSIYVSMSGNAEIDQDRGRIERLWTAFAKLWFPDGPTSIDLALLKFVPQNAEYWDAPHNRMVCMLESASSMAARRSRAPVESDIMGRLLASMRTNFSA